MTNYARCEDYLLYIRGLISREIKLCIENKKMDSYNIVLPSFPSPLIYYNIIFVLNRFLCWIII